MEQRDAASVRPNSTNSNGTPSAAHAAAMTAAPANKPRSRASRRTIKDFTSLPLPCADIAQYKLAR